MTRAEEDRSSDEGASPTPSEADLAPASADEAAKQNDDNGELGGPQGSRGAVSDPDDDAALSRSTKRWWWQRPTISTLKKEQRRHRSYQNKFDEKWNAETTPPPNELVHLGGVTLVEAFTPATVSSLYETLRRWPQRQTDPDQTWIGQLERGRERGGGWTSLGYVRRPEHFIMGDGYNDASLPEFVQAVWVTLAFVTPSVAMVCATFTFDEGAGDLTALTARKFRTTTKEVSVTVKGRFGDFRSRWPWSRPRRFSIWSRPIDVMFGKRFAVREKTEELVDPCREWFFDKFRGRFSVEETNAHPEALLLFSAESVPFIGHELWKDSLEWGWGPSVYRSTEVDGWAVKLDRLARDDRRWQVRFAAKRAEAGEAGKIDSRGRSNWSLTQRFHMNQAPIIALFGLQALLDLYTRRLARLRDTARQRSRLRRPVRDARRLDAYLLADGLDASTVTTDIAALTQDLTVFRWGIPEYREDTAPDAGPARRRGPIDLVPLLRDQLRTQGKRLNSDTASTDGNLRASAALRQAVANTRLQRTVVLVSMVALVIAVIGLIYG